MEAKYQEYLEFALEMAHAAGVTAMAGYQNSDAILKEDGTEVTSVDRRIERRLKAMIARRHPSHEILGEEYGGSYPTGARHLWVLDPIDGTSWYAMGAPLFGTLIALLENGEPVVGVIHMPALQETLYAAKGSGCWYTRSSSTKMRVNARRTVPLGKAVITASGVHGTNLHHMGNGAGWNLSGVISAAGKFKFYGDCVQHVLVCRGLSHAAIDTFMKPWDSAALIPCIQEAGGVAGTISGKHTGVIEGGSLVSACSQVMYDHVIRALRQRGDEVDPEQDSPRGLIIPSGISRISAGGAR